MKRLFIGIPIESVKAYQTTEALRKNDVLKGNVLKWVKPENWHITLIFLGSTPEYAIDMLQQLIEETFTDIQPFRTGLNGIGVFPNNHHPKVLWLGVDDIEFLMPAYTQMAELLQQNGFLLENKPLKPHLTLARIKNTPQNNSFTSLIEQYRNFDFGSVSINRVVLYESISTPEGPDYKPLFAKWLR